MVIIPPLSSPTTTVPGVDGYTPFPSSNIAMTAGAYPNDLPKSSSPPILSGCGKDIAQPTPIAPRPNISRFISASLCLGNGQPPSFSTSSSVMLRITKLPEGS